MKKVIAKLLACILALVLAMGMLPAYADGKSSVAIHLIGSSTTAMYTDAEHPLWGWGQAFSTMLDKDAAVFNWAVCGMSSRSCYNTIWPQVIDAIQPGDYLFIQFAGNDQKSNLPDTIWAPLEKENVEGYLTYEHYLNSFINEVRAKGAYPIIVTPVERLSALNASTMQLGPGQYADYAQAARDVATAANVPCVDLYARSREFIASFDTYEEIKSYYIASAPGHETDLTHLCDKGAKRMARFVLENLPANHEIKSHLLDEGENPAGVSGYYVSENFDTAQMRGPLVKPLHYSGESYKFDPYNNYWSTSLENNGDGKAMKISINATEENKSFHRVASKFPFTNAEGESVTVSENAIAYEFDVKFPVYDAERGETGAEFSLLDADKNKIFTTYLKNTSSGASVVSETGRKYATIESYAGQFMTVKNVIDLDTGFCVVYLNGAPVYVKDIGTGNNAAYAEVCGVPSGKKYNETSVDNIKVYTTEAVSPTDESLEGIYSDNIKYITDEDFEWDEYQTTTIPAATYNGVTVPERTIVHNDKSPIIGLKVYDTVLYNASTDADKVKYATTTSIVRDDEKHGKVFEFATTSSNWVNRRGLKIEHIYGAPDESNFRVIEFDFKFVGGEGYNPDGASLLVEYGGLYMSLKPDVISVISAEAKKYSSAEQAYNIPIAKYMTGLTNDKLSADTWYKFRILVDRDYRQCDLYIDDVLIAQDCDMPVAENESGRLPTRKLIRIGMNYASGAGIKAFRMDNLREYEVESAKALAIAKKGVEKFIGGKVDDKGNITIAYNDWLKKSGTDKEVLCLPFGGLTGYNYFLSSTNPIYDTNLHTPNMSYNWTASSDDSSLSAVRTTYNWSRILKDADKPPYEAQDSSNYNMYSTWNLNYDLLNGLPVDVETGNTVNPTELLGSSAVSTDGGVAAINGVSPDKAFELTVTIKKGDATDTVTKKIILQRPLLDAAPLGVNIGVPQISITRDSETDTNKVEFSSYVENTLEQARTFNLFIAFYNDENALIEMISHPITITPWTKYLCSKSGNLYTDVYTKPGVSLTGDEIVAIDKTVKKVKVFLWNANSGFSPIMDKKELDGVTYEAK